MGGVQPELKSYREARQGGPQQPARPDPLHRTTRTPKTQNLPWLVTQLDSGQLGAAAWPDQSCIRFLIPWKQRLRWDARQDWGFVQATAETSGAYAPERMSPTRRPGRGTSGLL